MYIKARQLNKGDKVTMWWEIFEYIKMDWMYAKWIDENWNIVTWQMDLYIKQDWIYVWVEWPVCSTDHNKLCNCNWVCNNT